MGMLKIYQLQHAKAFNNNIGALSHISDDLKVTTKRLVDQSEMDNIFNKDLTKQLNKLTTSRAECMEALETKTLELHHPAKRTQRPATITPTTDSMSSPQQNLPGRIEPLPNTSYRNAIIKISFDNNLITICSAITAQATRTLPINPRVICNILNQDIHQIIRKLSEHPKFYDMNVNAPQREDKILLETINNLKSDI